MGEQPRALTGGRGDSACEDQTSRVEHPFPEKGLAVQRGNSPYGTITLYPQPPRINIPGTALGTYALRGSAAVLFETSQAVNQNQLGIAVKQVEHGLMGIIDALADGTFDDIDPDRYDQIPER